MRSRSSRTTASSSRTRSEPSRGHSTKVTIDHDEIRRWAEGRGGRPAILLSTEGKGGPGIIRIEFPGARHAKYESLGGISWDEFVRIFDENELALVYEESRAHGKKSYFSKIVSRESVAHQLAGESRTPRASGTARAKSRAAGA